MAKGIIHKRARDRARRLLRNKKRFKIMKPSSGDLVAVQIAIQIFKRPKGFEFTRELLEELVREKARQSSGHWNGFMVEGTEEGPNPPGMKLSIIRWKNPDRLADEDTGWRYANPDSPEEQADAWGSLRRIIQSAPLSIGVFRNPRGKK